MLTKAERNDIWGLKRKLKAYRKAVRNVIYNAPIKKINVEYRRILKEGV